MTAALTALNDFALAAYHVGEFFVGVVLATLLCWLRWRSPWARR